MSFSAVRISPVSCAPTCLIIGTRVERYGTEIIRIVSIVKQEGKRILVVAAVAIAKLNKHVGNNPHERNC